MRLRQMSCRLYVTVIALGTAACRGGEPSGPMALGSHTLAVALGPGVSGAPVSGNAAYQNGAAVPYAFRVDSGYASLQVVLDSKLAPATGSIAMTQDHTLMASADRQVSLPPASDPLVQQMSGLLTATDPVATYRSLLRHLDSV